MKCGVVTFSNLKMLDDFLGGSHVPIDFEVTGYDSVQLDVSHCSGVISLSDLPSGYFTY